MNLILFKVSPIMIMNTRVVHINIIGKEIIHFISIEIINNDTQFSQNGV